MEAEEAFFVVHPLFFGWEDLAEETQEGEQSTRVSDREPRLLAITGRMPVNPPENHTHVQISDRAVINMADTQANLSKIDLSSLSNG